MADDAELLRRYAESASEEAFAALVQKHLNLVYSVALRHTAALVAHGVAPTVAKTAGYSLTLKLSAGLTLLGAVAVVLLFEHGPLIRTDDHGAPAITEGR